MTATRSVFAQFAQFAEALRQDWHQHSYEESVFSELAAEHLRRWDPQDQVDWCELLEEFAHTRRFDAWQSYSGFSDLQMIPYRDTKFYIEVLHWTSGSTTIHEHSFHGAFYLLRGESINAEYDFTPEYRFNAAFIVGQTQLRSTRHLKQGDTRVIKPSQGLIHSVFHLALPSITIVVRTNDLPWTMPQYEYRTPYLAVDNQRVNIDMIKRIQARSLFAEVEPERLSRTWLSMLQQCCLDEIYWTYRSVNRAWMDAELVTAADSYIRSLPGGSAMLDSLARERGIDRLIRLRANVQDYDLRLFIALSSIISQRAAIFDFMQTYYADGAKSKVQSALIALVELGALPLQPDALSEALIPRLADPQFDAQNLQDWCAEHVPHDLYHAIQHDPVLQALISA